MPSPTGLGSSIPSSRTAIAPPAISAPTISPQNPPAAKTLVYSPDVRIKIGHNEKEYDVSADIVSCDVQRVENAASSAAFVLSNKGQRYTGTSPKFGPMDRVLIYMYRISWIQVFSGYLDGVPYITLYEGACGFRATCTLKRLLHTWWNPNLPDSINLFNQQSADSQDQEKGGNGLDSGLGTLLQQLLKRAGGWQDSNIHIQNFPTALWSMFEDQFAHEADPTKNGVDAFKHLLLGDDISAGVGAAASTTQTVGASSPIGGPGGAAGAIGASSGVGSGQAFYISEIVRACDEMGLGPQTSDIKQAQAAQNVGQTGTDAMTRDAPAFADVTANAKAAQTSERQSDAAILAVMCCIVESSIRMLANNAVPESLSYPHDGFGSDHTSIGLFQQQSFPEWGSVAQRMNPHDSAITFFKHLVGVSGWRNMDPGAAVQAVQRSGFPGAYSLHQATATTLVQTYRSSQPAQVASGAAASPVGDAASTIPGASTAISAVAPATIPTTTPAAGALNPTSVTPLGPNAAAAVGKPSPDSEGAVQYAIQCIGLPYAASAGPTAYDCSGLMYAAYLSIGINIGRDTHAQASNLSGKRVSASQIQRGDLIMLNNQDHVCMWLGGGQILQSSTYGQPIAPKAAYFALDGSNSGTGWTVDAIYHVCDNGGINPAAPHAAPGVIGPGGGVPPAAVNSTTAAGDGTGQAANGGAGGEPIARNLFTYMYDAGSMVVDDAAALYSSENPEKAFIDGQPLIQAVQGMAKAGLRNFASAGNGDFIAYYPDYFGLDGKPAILDLEDIELVDVRVDWSDDALTTHVYINGNSAGGFANSSTLSQGEQEGWLQTAGVATVENSALFARMMAITPGDPDKLSGQAILKKYGIRPFVATYAMAGSQELEFLIAIQTFMTQWAAQYKTVIHTTFLPELFPGMRLNLVGHNLQVYVTAVSHHCTFTEEGFSTSATIMAPSNPGAQKTLGQIADQNKTADVTGNGQTAGVTTKSVQEDPNKTTVDATTNNPGAVLGGIN